MKICDFGGSRRIGKPRDWDNQLDGECLDIYVADSLDVQSGMPMMFSVYRPTPDELKALNEGGAIRLGIMGKAHPVFQMAVLSPRLCEVAGLVEMRDLGPVIDLEIDT